MALRGGTIGILAATLFAAPPTARAADFYAGKQITILAGSAAGGGYDLLARLMGRHLAKHIPGRPGIVVQNMPAASGLQATNFLANSAPRDGLTIGVVQRGMLLMKLTSPNVVQYDLGHFTWLGSLASETAVSLAWTEHHPFATNDIFTTEMITGAEIGVDPEITPRLYNALIGTKFKIVNGYNGTGEIGLAMQRGEVQGVGDWSWSSLKVQHPDWLRDKKVTVLLQGGLGRNSELPDVPNALEFVKTDLDRRALQLYFTQKTVARPVLAPPDVPAERATILRNAFAALASDAAFLDDARASKLDVGPIDGAAVDKAIATITATSPEVTQRYIAGATAQNGR